MYSELARRIRAELDKRMGSRCVSIEHLVLAPWTNQRTRSVTPPRRGWSVVVGRSYGAFITHKIKSYAYLSVFPGVNVLLWKA